jgi:two-component system, OmpR family, sensor histidine kinase BaeS
VPVQADRNRIVRVLRNLTDNAARYTPERGKLEIGIGTAKGDLRVAFRNDVETVDHEDLPYLFERFYRSEKSRSREHGGAGIGLAIVKELVKAHGGRVGADLGDGCIEIWFTLPIDAHPRDL